MKKRKQHYVWEHYLKAWTAGGTICCQRGKVRFKTDTNNVANERDFYRLREMSERDFEIVESMIDRMEERVRAGARGWLPHFRVLHQLKREYGVSGSTNPELEACLDEAINNLEEDMHAGIEGDAIHLLAALQREDTSLLDDDDAFIHFARFIAAQYMRTPGVQSRSIESPAIVPGFNMEASFGLMRTIFSTNMGFGFFQKRHSLRVTFLNAPSGVEFITGDQPIVNTRASRMDREKPPTELELYYPLMPERALLLDFDSGYARESRRLTEAQVYAYNDIIAAASRSQIYAKNESMFLRLRHTLAFPQK